MLDETGERFARRLQLLPGVTDERRAKVGEFAQILARTVQIMRPVERPEASVVKSSVAVEQLDELKRAGRAFELLLASLNSNTLAALLDARHQYNSSESAPLVAPDPRLIAAQLEALRVSGVLDQAIKLAGAQEMKPTMGRKRGHVARRLAEDAALVFYNLTDELPTKSNRFVQLLADLFADAELKHRAESYVVGAVTKARASVGKK